MAAKEKAYYIKLLPTLEQRFPGIPGPDWQRDLFDDITEKGTCVHLEMMPPDKGAPRVALHGSRFCCEVKQDSGRPDTIYVFRIQSTKLRLPRSVPRKVIAQFQIWRPNSPTVDDASELLIHGFEPESSPAPPNSIQIDEPSPSLIQVLAETPSRIRDLFRPGPRSTLETDVDTFLQTLRKPWLRHRLDRYAEATPRQSSVLKGVIKPPVLDAQDRAKLLELFGFGLLNAAAADNRKNLSEFWSLLESIADLSLSVRVRAGIWAAIVSGLSGGELRLELAAIAGEFQIMEVTEQPDSHVWAIASIRALRAVADRHEDVDLKELANTIQTAQYPLRSLAERALALEGVRFEEPEVVIIPVAPESLQGLGVAPPSGSSLIDTADVVNEWVLRLRGGDRAELQPIADGLKTLHSRISGAIPIDPDIGWIEQVSELLTEYRAHIDDWLSKLPDATELRRDIDEAKAAYEVMDLLLGAGTLEFIRGLPAGVTPIDVLDIAALAGC